MPQNKVWFFTNLFTDPKKVFEPGDQVDIQIMRVGERNHDLYGEVVVTEQVIKEVIDNFENNTRGVELAVDENHEPNHRALGWFKRLYQKGADTLFATIELTRKGAEMLTDGAYKYFSPEIIFGPFLEEESGETIENLLTGGAFTNRPFFKKMEPLLASEGASSKQQSKEEIFLHVLEKPIMEKFNELLKACEAKSILSFSEKFDLKAAFNELSDEEKTEDLETSVNEQIEKPSEETTEETKEDSEGSEEGSDEGESKEGTQEETKEPVKASEGVITAEMYNEQQEQIAKMSAQLKRNSVEKEFNESFAFSSQNKKGVFNAQKHKDAFVDFVVTLNDSQKSKFYEIIGNVDPSLADKFSELGHDHKSEGDHKSYAQIYHEKVKEIMDSNKEIDYYQATQILDKKAKS